jgi:Zinc carboxypeptidase
MNNRCVLRAACTVSLGAFALGACHQGGLQTKVDPRAVPGAMAAGRAAAEAGRHAPYPLTRAERVHFTETSRLSDVYMFLDSLARVGAPITELSMGKSAEGADLPFIVASRPAVRTPAEARASGKPIVYVQGDIHAGEVEGKEALQMVLRDLALDPRPNVLDSIVLIAVPVYNADGNENIAPQTINRTEQNGPVLVGTRANAMGLDLNRDYTKAEAPETRAALSAFVAWDPDMFVDLHTTDGSYHGYALTYAPSLHPGATLRAFNQDTLLPELQKRVRERRHVETFPYGNFMREEIGGGGGDRDPRAALLDTNKRGWATYDSHARFGTNYYGLRGKLSVLSEAFSHDPFQKRVESTYAFLRELLSLVGEQGPGIVARTRRLTVPDHGVLRARLTTSPFTGPVIAEDLVRTDDSTEITEPGVPRGIRRTGHFRTIQMPIYDRFEPTLRAALPAGGWTLGADQASAVHLLRLHGVRVERVDSAADADAQLFRTDSVIHSSRPFQGHNETRLEGEWRAARRHLEVGAFVVPVSQPLALVAQELLEPQSDDGIATWNGFDAALKPGGDFPVARLTAVPTAKRTAIP